MADIRDLVGRARRGETAAFEALVRGHYRAAYAVALALLGSPMDAEDVCQDAFVRALDRLDELRQPERFPGWLMQIVRNRARNVREYEKVRTAVSLDKVEAAGREQTNRGAERGELRARLGEALDTLSETQREVVLLHDMEGWKHKEIAASLDISEVNARQHLFTARKLLRERLGENALKEYVNE